MKLTGERLRAQKYAGTGELMWDKPADCINADLKYMVYYDFRSNGRIYHANGKLFHTREEAMKEAIHG